MFAAASQISALAMPLASPGVVAESIVHEACYVVMPKRHRLGALLFVSTDFGDQPMISIPSKYRACDARLILSQMIVASYLTTVSSPTSSVRCLISYRAGLASPSCPLRLFPR